MADSHIGGLGSAASLAGTDKMIVEQSGVAKQTTVDDILSLGDWGKLDEVIASSTPASITLSSIPSTYTDLIVRVYGRGTKAATLVDISCRINGDTGANYDVITRQSNNSTATTFQSAAGSFAYVGNLAAASAPAGVADMIELQIPNYANTSFHKVIRKEASLKAGSAASNLYTETGHVWWRSTAAITSLTIYPGANAFANGTIVTLYGRR